MPAQKIENNKEKLGQVMYIQMDLAWIQEKALKLYRLRDNRSFKISVDYSLNYSFT